jgi:hypothetical protein
MDSPFFDTLIVLLARGHALTPVNIGAGRHERATTS